MSNAQKISRESALEQWELFRAEYNLAENDSELDLVIQAARKQILRDIEAGDVEIVDDSKEGVIVCQHLRRAIGDDGMSVLAYKPPTTAAIARAGIGKEQLVSQVRYQRLACACTGQSEDRLKDLRGGDRSRMETIASLFLSA